MKRDSQFIYFFLCFFLNRILSRLTKFPAYRKDTSTDVTGYIAADHTNKLIVVAFRGSTSFKNWLTDLAFAKKQTDICASCTAHHGFWQSWLDARDRVLPAVAQATAANPSYQLRVTGHSLGGAIAALAAASLRNDNYTVAMYTFGSPRIGGTKISEYITQQPGGNYRVTHWNDPVPKLPPIAVGYVHISPEYYINKPNESVQATDVNVYTGLVSFQGNTRWLSIDTHAHMWYFQNMSVCNNVNEGKKTGLQMRGVEGDVEVLATF